MGRGILGENTVRRGALLAALTAGIVYMALLVRYAVNVPNADDFDMFIGFLLKFGAPQSALERLTLLFQRHGEHYIVFNRLAVLLPYYLLGTVNFRWIILIGNLAVPLLGWLFYLTLPRGLRNPLRILPVALLLFAPHYPEASMWAAAAIEHLWVTPFMLAAFLLCDRGAGTRRIGGAVLCALCATFTQGNGVFTWAGLALISLRRGERRVATGWVAVFLGLLWLHAQSAQEHGNSGFPALSEYAAYVLSFLGSSIAPGFVPAVFAGALLTGFSGYALLQRRRPVNAVPLAIAATSILTALANGIGRAQFGAAYAVTQTRYHYPSIVFVIACYLLCCELFPRISGARLFSGACSLLASIFFVHSVASDLPEYRLRHDLLQESIIRWQIAGQGLEYPSPAHAADLFLRLTASGAYLTPGLPPAPRTALPGPVPAARRGGLAGKIEHLLHGAHYLLVSGYAFPRSAGGESSHTLIALRGNGRELLYPVEPRERPDVVRHHHGRPPLRSGFFAVIDTSGLPSGSYEIAVLLTDGSSAVSGLVRPIVISSSPQ